MPSVMSLSTLSCFASNSHVASRSQPQTSTSRSTVAFNPSAHKFYRSRRVFSGSELTSKACHSRRTSCRAAASSVLQVDESNFEAEVLKSDVPVLVDFWATWCGPCKLVDPSMTWAEKEYAGSLKVVKCEADPNPTLVEKYKVYGLPTIMLFKDGEKIVDSHHEGAITRPNIAVWLEKFGIAAVAKKA